MHKPGDPTPSIRNLPKAQFQTLLSPGTTLGPSPPNSDFTREACTAPTPPPWPQNSDCSFSVDCTLWDWAES